MKPFHLIWFNLLYSVLLCCVQLFSLFFLHALQTFIFIFNFIFIFISMVWFIFFVMIAFFLYFAFFIQWIAAPSSPLFSFFTSSQCSYFTLILIFNCSHTHLRNYSFLFFSLLLFLPRNLFFWSFFFTFFSFLSSFISFSFLFFLFFLFSFFEGVPLG